MTRTIHVVVGGRPNQMKAAPLLRALREHSEFTPILADTGQHHDHEMAGIFVKQFGIRGVQPAHTLEMIANAGTVATVSHSRVEPSSNSSSEEKG